MSFIGDIFDSRKGAGFQAQQGATTEQANQLFGNVTSGLDQQQKLINALQAQNGIGNLGNAYNMAQQTATGQGANPALAQLAQATQANTSNQAALMAGQRGTSGNAGLMARQIAQQGAQNQQNSAGQAATLQAQQQLAGQQQMANIAAQQQAAQQQAVGQYNQFAQGAQGNVLNSLGGQNSANASIAGINAGTQAGILNKAAGAAGSALMPGMAHGGMVAGPSSMAGRHLCMQSGGQVPGQAAVPGDSYANDTVPAMLSPGEVVIPKHIMESSNPSKNAAKFVAALLARKG